MTEQSETDIVGEIIQKNKGGIFCKSHPLNFLQDEKYEKKPC